MTELNSRSTSSATPDRTEALLSSLRRKRSEVAERLSPRRLNGCRPADVRNVLMIVSASRSGSSVLHYLLARRPGVVSLNGEDSVFARLHGLGWAKATDDSDFIAPENPAALRVAPSIAEDILLDSGELASHAPADKHLRENYLADSVQRLLLQFPQADASPDELLQACTAALGDRAPNQPGFSAADYWRLALERLHGAGLDARLGHYDLRGSDPAADFPNRGNVQPPPFSDFCLEEPPFVVPQPRRLPSPKEFEHKTLLLKSSSDCYRLWLTRRLFPNARFKFVVLARNPAAAINGLIDGWLSDGFYSQNLGDIAALDVQGYSRDDRPWTRQWWNFDLPPGWAQVRNRPLEDVCARQWLSANQHILSGIRSGLIEERLDVRYESFLEPRSLAATLRAIVQFAGLPGDPTVSVGSIPAVMSVTPPAPQKWRKRRDVLAGLVQDGEIAALAREFGYDPDRWESWA